jgi:hypothetical protein
MQYERIVVADAASRANAQDVMSTCHQAKPCEPKHLRMPTQCRHVFAWHSLTKINTETAVTLEQDKNDFRISRSTPTLRASVPNLDQDTFARLAQDAEQNCPVSKVLRAEITLDVKLV